MSDAERLKLAQEARWQVKELHEQVYPLEAFELVPIETILRAITDALESAIAEKQAAEKERDEARALNESYLETTRQSLEQNRVLRKALDEISDPIKFMRQRAEAENGTLNGSYAIILSADATFLKSIAREALRAAGKL